MQHAIKLEIKRISRKYLSKIQKIDSVNAEYQDKFRKRTGLEPFIRQHNKSYVDKLFSPSYCARNANFLAKMMSGIHLAIPVFSKGYRPKQGKVAP